MAMPELISFVVPVLNNEARLRLCLESIRRQRCDVLIEVIVVDNGSSDGSQTVAGALADKVIVETSGKSPYLCRNKGIREATGDLLILLDSNVVLVGEAWLSEAISSFRERPFDLGVPHYSFDFANPQAPSVSEVANTIFYLDSEKDTANGGAAGPCMMCPRDTFVRYGLFPLARSNGDTVWSNSLTKLGGRIHYLTNITCRYPAKSSLAMKRTEIRIGYGNRGVWLSKGDSRLKVALRSLRNMTPWSLSQIRAVCAARNIVLPDNVSMRNVFFFVWTMKIYRGLGRLGIRRFGRISAD